jgi:hypothetical protein
MCPSIPDNLLLITSLNPSDIHEIIIRDDIPSIKPIMLKIVEKEIKPKLWLERRCRRAIRVVRFICLHAA